MNNSRRLRPLFAAALGSLALVFTPASIAVTGSASGTSICNQTLDTTTAVTIQLTSNGDCLVKFLSGSNGWVAPVAITTVNYLVVGGGGAGGSAYEVAAAGGGGGGEVLSGTFTTTPGTRYDLAVGLGGEAPNAYTGSAFTGASAATSSTFANVVARPGGAGSSRSNRTTIINATALFTGGGGSAQYDQGSAGATPSAGQGGKGGNGYPGNAVANRNAGGGGGGAGGAGEAGFEYNTGFLSSIYGGGKGGLGIANSLETGTAQFYGAGGGGGMRAVTFAPGAGGSGIGGNGGSGPLGSIVYPTAGAQNTGSGGGGAGIDSGGTTIAVGGAGAKGLVLLRYRPNLNAIPSDISFSSTLYKGQETTISARSEFAGIVSFYVNGKIIPRCRNVRTSGAYPSNTATCAWKPSVQGSMRVKASVAPTDLAFFPASSEVQVSVKRRTNLR